MYVLIPHPTEELLLTKIQKELIAYFHNQNKIYTASNPLWIPIEIPAEDLSKGLKNAGNNITKITLENLHFTENKICYKVVINYADTILNSKLPLLIDLENMTDHEKKSLSVTAFDNCKKKSCTEVSLPAGISDYKSLNLKIFRLGIAVENPEEHSITLQDSVWRKI